MRWRRLSVGDEKETTRELGNDGESFIYSTPNARLRNASDQLYPNHQRFFISSNKTFSVGLCNLPFVFERSHSFEMLTFPKYAVRQISCTVVLDFVAKRSSRSKIVTFGAISYHLRRTSPFHPRLTVRQSVLSDPDLSSLAFARRIILCVSHDTLPLHLS
jgi:hypothetical protein